MAARIRLTAFAPFEGRTRNQSAEVLAALGALAAPRPASHGPQPDWDGEIWPVHLPELLARVRAALEQPPDLWLALGEAPPDSPVRWESCARNRYDLRRDPPSAGGLPLEGVLDPGGPPLLRVHWPCAALAAAAPGGVGGVRLSSDAGAHCCNALLYAATRAAARAPQRPWIGFLHLPRRPEQVPEQARLLHSALQWLHAHR